MLRVKLSKLRQVCATVFIPRILKEPKKNKGNIDKYSIEYLGKRQKNTDSKDEDYEKRKRIIDKCFAEKTPVLEETEKDLPLMQDKVKLYESVPGAASVDKTNTLVSNIFGNDKLKEIKTDQVLRNAQVQDIAAKVEEVKLAHDIISSSKPTDDNIGEESKLAPTTIEIGKPPNIQINEANAEEVGSSKISALLQNTNIQTTTGPGGEEDEEKLKKNIVHIDKITNVGENKAECNPTVNILEVPEDGQPLDKTEKIAHHVVHVDKNPFININTTKAEDLKKLAQHIIPIDRNPYVNIKVEEVNSTLKVSETLRDAEVEAATPKVQEEKISPHIVQIDQTPLVQATTAKIEEEKLTQKIDHIDETPHVEAGVSKVEDFIASQKVLGYEPKFNINEPSIDTFSDEPEKVNLDELAKKCLGKPDGDIDQILLKELKNMSHLNSIKFDLPKDDSTQKYFSQIFNNKTKDNNNIVFDISTEHLEQILRKEIKDDTAMKFENFHPFHLDTVPVVIPDTKEDKDECKHSPDIKNVLLDIPAVLDPYDMQAIPFYQYVSKENIVLQEQPVQEPPEKITQETVVPENEEIILERDDSTVQKLPSSNEPKELETETEDQKTSTAYSGEQLSEVDHVLKLTEKPSLSESDVSKLLEYKKVLSAQEESRRSSDIVSNECTSPTADTEPNTAETELNTQSAEPTTMEQHPLEDSTQTVLTAQTTAPADPFGNPMQPTSASDDSYHPDNERRPNENQDTAISANQEPGEYFPTHHLNSFTGNVQAEYEVSDSCVTFGIFDTKITPTDNTYDAASENLMSQSVSYFSTFPQLLDFDGGEYKAKTRPKRKLDNKNLFMHVLLQPEPKRKVARSKPKRAPRFDTSISAAESPCSENMPLSVLLKRVRARSRMELINSVQAEVEVGKKPTCLPPLDRSKPKTTLMPPRCQPKPKEKECKEPQPCKPPEKKDPCAKFAPFIIPALIRSSLDVPLHITVYNQIYTYVLMAKEMACQKFETLTQMLGLNIKQNGTIARDSDDVMYAKDFDPWVPIPSWPITKVEKRRRVVSPKEGCKLPVHPVPSNTDKPCLGMPKKISPTKTLIYPFMLDGLT